MRKYKFRGKRADNGKWVYGDLLYIAGGCMIYFGSSTDTVEPDIENSSPVAVELFNEEVAVVDPATVSLFTGCSTATARKFMRATYLKGALTSGDLKASPHRTISSVMYDGKSSAMWAYNGC